MTAFAFSTAGRIIFGAGTAKAIADEVAGSMAGNPVALDHQTLEQVIRRAMQKQGVQ